MSILYIYIFFNLIIKKDGEDDKGSLQIKIHLNLHAKIKLELDAQIYGDIVIGLL
ncbi:unnamed protein product [Penicillium camemberti]|uniref:Str. FM013 n=1 Tax=Penicillium camemberti (strain FM 013) TaxID=1429867 RepID=A0A0G4PSR4_PENC3|nr:unnamed protein product [Penicillium camemberti]